MKDHKRRGVIREFVPFVVRQRDTLYALTSLSRR